MDKEKEIEMGRKIRRTRDLFDFFCDFEIETDKSALMARNLRNVIYECCEQAVRKFAEDLKAKAIIMGDYCEHMVKISKIDELIKERFGEEVRKE